MGWVLLILYFALLLVGFAMLVVGWRAEVDGFWDSHPYFTNVFSSFTAAFFGIPLALVILQRLSAVQSERTQRRSVASLRLNAVGRFVESVDAFLVRDHIDGHLELKIQEVARLIGAGCMAVGASRGREDGSASRIDLSPNYFSDHYDWRTPFAADFDSTEHMNPREVSRMLKEASAKNLAIIGSAGFDSPRYQVQWSAMKEQWRFLKEVVKPTVLQVAREQWIDLETEAGIERFLGGDQFVFTYFASWRQRSVAFDVNINSPKETAEFRDLESATLGHRDAVDACLSECLELARYRKAVRRAFDSVAAES